MKIAHLTLYPPKNEKHVNGSGVASYSRNLTTYLGNEGDAQIVICNKISDDTESYREDGITVHRILSRKPKFILQAHAALQKIDPDVVHIQQELALFGGILTAYLLQWLVFLWRKKTVITLHGVVDPQMIDTTFIHENNAKLPVWLVRLAFRIIYTPLMKWSKAVIVHEEYFKKIMIASYGIAPEKIFVIPHGVEMLQTDDSISARQQLNLPTAGKVVLFMGYATGYKGIDLLIDGFSQFATKNKDAFLIIGAGKHPKLQNDPIYLKEYARLQAKAAACIPKNQYIWHGFISESEITSYYSASNVSVYPYTTAMSSSGPMSFAIGYEKPFLASSAFKPIFEHHPELIFAHTPNAMAGKLTYFFAHQATYATALRTFRSERSWDRIGQATLSVYHNIKIQKEAYEPEESIITG